MRDSDGGQADVEPGLPPGGAPRGGARRGARRGAKPKRSFRPDLAGLALAALGALAVWGVMVWVAIGAGRDARGGDSGAWGVVAAASVGAALCLFLGLWLVTVALRRAGVLDGGSDRDRPSRH